MNHIATVIAAQLDGAYVTRKVTATASSGPGVAEALITSVEATVTTDTDLADDCCVGLELELRRPGLQRRRVSLDVPASELDVVVAAVSEAIRLARESGVIAGPLAQCGAVGGREGA